MNPMRKTKIKMKQFTVRMPACQWEAHRKEAEKLFGMGSVSSDNQLACFAINNATTEMTDMNIKGKKST
jgi:hypothetical protein